MHTQLLNSIIAPLTAVDPVWLEAAPAEQPAAAPLRTGWIGDVVSASGLGVALTALFVVLAVILTARHLLKRSRTTDLNAAFARLSTRMHVSSKARKTILSLSEASGIPAAAMLVSRGAFTAALANADTQSKAPPREESLRIMRGLFAELTPPPR